jgi:hypothetical protein
MKLQDNLSSSKATKDPNTCVEEELLNKEFQNSKNN